MEPILVCGFPAGSSMGLLAVLEWLGKPYKITRVDMLGEMQQSTYAKLNPRHETPILVTDSGRVLTETMAIAGWLEARDLERRVSFDPLSAEADRMRQVAAFINTGFTGAFAPLWAAWEGQMPEAEKVTLRAFGAQLVCKRHDQLEQLLDHSPYAVGDRPTLADGIFIGVARWVDFHGLGDPGRWPRTTRLRSALEGDLAVQFATSIEAGDMVPGSGALSGTMSLTDLISKFGAAA
ncbi:glutathione S-transferase [Sphingomonas sp. UYAg733]